MPSAYSFDGRILAPYAMQDIGEFWDRWFSQRFSFRSFTLGKSNSKSKAAYRFSRILREKASWLDGSSKTDINVLLDTWRAKMLGVSTYMEQNGVAEAEGVMNKPVNAMINFWTFHASGCRHIQHLSCLQLGIDQDGSLKVDQDRRKQKAELLREFNSEVKRFTQKAAYVVGFGPDSNKRLEQALELTRQALMQAEEDLDWEGN